MHQTFDDGNRNFFAQVCVHSPPRVPALSDPDTYYEKFSKHGEIVFITICLRNGALLKVRHEAYTCYAKNAFRATESREEGERERAVAVRGNI